MNKKKEIEILDREECYENISNSLGKAYDIIESENLSDGSKLAVIMSELTLIDVNSTKLEYDEVNRVSKVSEESK